MLCKIIFFVFLSLSGAVSGQNDPRAVLVQNFLNSNKEIIKSAKNDEVLSDAIVSSLHLNTSFPALQDDSSNNLVLMDSSVVCDAGWKKSTVNGMCYMISSTDTTWYAAEDWCYNQRYGSHLTSVHSQAEAQWIAATYITGFSWLPFMDNWVGLRRSCDNTSYIWTDGTPVDYLWWQPGYPGSKDPELSCVTIWVNYLLKLNPAYTPGMFDDIWDCGGNTATPTCRYDPTSTAPHIKYDTTYTCKDSTTVGTTTTTPVTTTIPTTITTTPTTTTATQTTTTTTPTTTTETSTTTTETTTTTTPTTTTVTTTTPTTETTTTLTTTTPTTTTTIPITTSTATTTTTSKTTATIPTTTPTTSTATTKLSVTTSTTIPNGPVDCSSKCDSYWISYNGGCYGIVQGTANFATAAKGCQAFGGEMAVIEDVNMNEAMRLAFSSNNDSTIANQAWIGTSSYANWAPNKPNQAQGTNYTSYCNVMTLSVVNSGADFGFSRGVWTDYPCSLPQEYVICKQSQ